MVIDIYTHIFPAAAYEYMQRLAPDLKDIGKRIASLTFLHDLDGRFREMDAYGDYRQIISMPNPPIEDITTPEQGIEMARAANDAMAALVQKHPDRFPAFVAAMAMHNMDETMPELERAVEQLGARGVQVFTNVAGRPLDDEEFQPLFDRMAGYGLPIWMHPVRTAATKDYESEDISRFEIWTALGWPYATSVAMLRLAYTGLFDRHPGIKIITHHLGGIIPYHEGRMLASFTNLGRRSSGEEDYVGMKNRLRRPMMDYLHMFYGDTAMHGAVNPTRCGIEFFGPGHVVFASDAPFASIPKSIDMMDRIELSDRDRDAIMIGNAERLMKMKLR